jgi:hypothetical protein
MRLHRHLRLVREVEHDELLPGHLAAPVGVHLLHPLVELLLVGRLAVLHRQHLADLVPPVEGGRDELCG